MMVFQESVCHPTLFGRLLGLKSVRLYHDTIVIGQGRNAVTLTADELSALPEYKEGWFSARWHIYSHARELTVRLLPKKMLASLHQQVVKTLIEAAPQRIKQTHLQFITQAGSSYLRDSHIAPLSARIAQMVALYSETWPADKPLDAASIQTLHKLQQVNPLGHYAEALRARYETLQLEAQRHFLDNVEANPLTLAQRQAVIRNNDHNLVLAAAGTGKTSVMVGKALSLLATGQAHPSQILILAYNSAAAAELKARIQQRATDTGVPCEGRPAVMTFHALGRHILHQSGITPALSVFTQNKQALEEWATEWLKQDIAHSDQQLHTFMQMLYQPVDPFRFDSPAHYEAYLRDTEYRSLQGERVKGYQALLIANWLYMQGIDYTYAPGPPANSAIAPVDFQITGTQVYLVHHTLDRHQQPQPGVEKAAYLRLLSETRKWYRAEQATLIETFHYQWSEGQLTSVLKTQLSKAGIRLQARDKADIIARLEEQNALELAAQRFLSCLQAIRMEQLDETAIATRLQQHGVINAELYAQVLAHFHRAYQNELSVQQAIDFDDMISRATTCVENAQWKPGYRHILVDEFQDISTSRMALLKSLLEQGPAPILTAVGDDWQAIYRFSGGKLALTTEFERYVGSHTVTRLEKTFRYNSSIAHTAGQFVMANPYQYKKRVDAHEQVDEAQIYLLDDLVYGQQDATQRAKHIVAAIRKKSPGDSIAIMARYRFLLEDARTTLQPLSQDNLFYWTFHGAKGLEADHCILLGFNHGKLGFPSQNKADILLEALLPAQDEFAYAEERRLFYVALTRARHKCYIIADPLAPSAFITELTEPSYQVNIASDTFTEGFRAVYKCPSCDSGYYKKRKGQYGEYYQCSAQPGCSSKPRMCKTCSAPAINTGNGWLCRNPAC